MNEINIFREGGLILIALIIFGIGALIIFFERLIYLHKARIHHNDFLNGIFNILRKQKIHEALMICDETPGPIPQLVRSAITHKDENTDSLRLILDHTSHVEISRMERRLAVLSTVIKTTPLLGLLGGLIGIFTTVVAIRSNASLVQTLDLTSGLYQALITAIAGLAVMIPTYVMYNILIVRIDRIILDMEHATIDIIAFMPHMKNTNKNNNFDKNNTQHANNRNSSKERKNDTK